LNVAFDGTVLGAGPITGVGRAFLNGLQAYGAAGFAGRTFLLLPADAPDPRVEGITVVQAPRGALPRQVALPRLLRRLAADVLHSPVAAVPLFAPCPTVATVHDLPWLEPGAEETTSRRRRLVTRWSLRRASAVLAPSAFTLAAARRLLPEAAAGKVRLLPHATPRWPDGGSRDAATRRGPFLVLGDDRPRKNRERTMAAHTRALAACPGLPELRFVGPPAEYVGEADKVQLLRASRALVQCSLFEGFGMPVLEAMAHALPILGADIPPFHELAADAALYVDPRDVGAMAAGFVRIHADAALRAGLARAGWQRASLFEPAGLAGRWRALHEELAAVPR
jgi:Glycosyl transferases group 1/Glycosyltransferase Family 4